MKLSFSLWLIHPDFLGAFYLYHKWNERFFEPNKDSFLSVLHERVASLTRLCDSLLEKMLAPVATKDNKTSKQASSQQENSVIQTQT